MSLQSQEFTTPGAFSFTPDPGITHLWVTVLGAGGGGERDLSGNNAGGTGGGAGELLSMMPFKVTPSVAIPGVVGAKGLAGFYANHTLPSGGAIATVGGNSSFGPFQALGGGRGETQTVPFTVASYGGGVNGGLQGNPNFPVFADTFGGADSSRWFGGSGGGAYANPNISPNQPGMNGGPSGGRLLGGAGGATAGPGTPPAGPGGGGAATVYGVGGAGGDDLTNGHAAAFVGTGGGGAGGTTAHAGVGPFLDGSDGFDGYVCVFWFAP